MTSFPLSARRRPRRPAAALAVLVALATLAGVAPAAAGSAAAAEDPRSAPVTFAVAPSANGVVTAGQPLTVMVAAQNPGTSGVASAPVRVSASATALRTRAEVDGWLAQADGARTPTERALGDGVVPVIPAGGRSVVGVAVDPALLADLPPGVYPLRADYDGAQADLSAVSVLVVGGDAGTGALGVVVPITGPPIGTGLLSADELGELTASGGALRERLDAVTGTAAILAVDPAVVAAIRVLGTSAPASATQWLDDLMALPNSRFALQFGDADLAVQVGAGLSAPLTIGSLASYLSSADFATTPTPTPTPTASTPAPTPTPSATGRTGGPPLPTLEELTDVGAGAGNVFWPATGTGGSEVVAALGGLTVDDVRSITLVDSARVTSGSPTPAWARAGEAQVLVYDAKASGALSAAASSDDPVARANALAAASAYAALAVGAAPDAPLLVAVDRSEDGSLALAAAVSAGAALGGRAATDLAALTAGAPAAVSLESAPAAGDRVAGLTALMSDESALAGFATILDDPAVLTVPERAAILQLLGNGWAAEPERAADAFDAHRAQTTATLGAVAVVPPSDITLAATSAPLTFSVRNDLKWPVSLVLIATQNDPRLIVQNTTPVEAGAAQNTRVQIPVQARVGSGESTLSLQLRSPSMVAVGDPVPVHVAVRAEWESVGLVVMVTLVAAMIVLGVIRTVRRRRRIENTAATENTATTEATDA